MKILPDENLPQKMRALLIPMHDPYTVGHLGWEGIGNGRLLSLAASHAFEALITTDKSVQYQQNMALLPWLGGNLERSEQQTG